MSELLIRVRIEPLEEGGYLATSDDLQGLIAQGRTIAETLEIARDVAQKLIESHIEHGDPLPQNLLTTPQKPKRKTTLSIEEFLEQQPETESQQEEP